MFGMDEEPDIDTGDELFGPRYDTGDSGPVPTTSDGTILEFINEFNTDTGKRASGRFVLVIAVKLVESSGIVAALYTGKLWSPHTLIELRQTLSDPWGHRLLTDFIGDGTVPDGDEGDHNMDFSEALEFSSGANADSYGRALCETYANITAYKVMQIDSRQRVVLEPAKWLDPDEK